MSSLTSLYLRFLSLGRSGRISVISGVAGAGLFAVLSLVHVRHAGPNPASVGGITVQDGLTASAQASSLAPGPSPCEDFYSMICHTKGTLRDPTGFVRSEMAAELKAHEMQAQISSANPTWNGDQVEQEFIRLVYTPKKVVRLRAAFEWVRHSLIRIIDNQSAQRFSTREKKQLKATIRHLELDLPTPEARYADEPDIIFKSSVVYESSLPEGRTRIRVGGAYLLMTDSWFNWIFTFAHEITHSIDPCEIRVANQSYPSYDHLASCFIATGLIGAKKTRTECGENDQLSEAYADWMATKVTSEALLRFATEFDHVQLRHAMANSVRDLCEEDENLPESDLTYHPSARVRIQKIFGANPAIRGMLGCSAETVPRGASGATTYCTFDWTFSGAKHP